MALAPFTGLTLEHMHPFLSTANLFRSEFELFELARATVGPIQKRRGFHVCPASYSKCTAFLRHFGRWLQPGVKTLMRTWDSQRVRHPADELLVGVENVDIVTEALVSKIRFTDSDGKLSS